MRQISHLLYIFVLLDFAHSRHFAGSIFFEDIILFSNRQNILCKGQIPMTAIECLLFFIALRNLPVSNTSRKLSRSVRYGTSTYVDIGMIAQGLVNYRSCALNFLALDGGKV